MGELEEKLWYQLVESLIQKAGEQALLDALIEWESNHNYTRDSPQEVRKEALRLHTARLFDDPRWIHFVPFNRKYRPEALEAAHLVTVVSECCHTPGVPFPVSWTVKMKKKQKETQDILSYHSQAAGCSDKARAKASGGRQPIEECGRTGL